MQFAPDTVDMLAFIVALANTDPAGSRSDEDELTSIGQLEVLLSRHRYSGRVDHDAAELAQVRATRSDLRRIWSLPRDRMVEAVNEMFTETPLLLKLARHDDLDWHLHTTPPQAPLVERMRVESAFALVDVIRADANDRLRICEAPDCEGLLVDLSRNSSKRFCSVRCSNRVNMIAYRERQADL